MTDTVLILIIFLAVDLIALSALLFYHLHREWKRNRIRHYGDRAEEQVTEYIGEMIPGSVLLNDIFLKTKRGITQIDHILLSKWGIFVIETKSHNGTIHIGPKEWVQIYGEKVVRFHSPLLQNASHCHALEMLLSAHGAFRRLPVKGVVVFTSGKVRFSRREQGVIRLEELDRYVKNKGSLPPKKAVLTADPHGFYLSRQKILSLEKWILSHSVKSRRRKQNHASHVRKMDRNRGLL